MFFPIIFVFEVVIIFESKRRHFEKMQMIKIWLTMDSNQQQNVFAWNFDTVGQLHLGT